MNPYELMMLFDPALGDERIGAIATKIEDKIKGFGGEITKLDKWGIRRLASMLSNAPKLHSAYYIVIFFNATTSLPVQLQKLLKVEENIVRYAIIRAEEKKVDAISGKPLTSEAVVPVVVGDIPEGSGEALGGI